MLLEDNGAFDLVKQGSDLNKGLRFSTKQMKCPANCGWNTCLIRQILLCWQEAKAHFFREWLFLALGEQSPTAAAQENIPLQKSVKLSIYCSIYWSIYHPSESTFYFYPIRLLHTLLNQWRGLRNLPLHRQSTAPRGPQRIWSGNNLAACLLQKGANSFSLIFHARPRW